MQPQSVRATAESLAYPLTAGHRNHEDASQWTTGITEDPVRSVGIGPPARERGHWPPAGVARSVAFVYLAWRVYTPITCRYTIRTKSLHLPYRLSPKRPDSRSRGPEEG
jgi:hypothetical protein